MRHFDTAFYSNEVVNFKERLEIYGTDFIGSVYGLQAESSWKTKLYFIL